MPTTRQERDYAYWEQEFDAIRHGELKSVQTAATNWSKAISGLMAVFTTVAFAGGLTTIDKLPTDVNLWITPADTLVGDIKVMVLLAFGLALVATVLVTLAAGDILPKTRVGDSPTKLWQRSLEQARTSLILLRVGQVVSLGAAALVLAGSLVIFLTPEKQTASDPPIVVAQTESGVVCGQLSGSPTALAVAGSPLLADSSITVVDACPEP